MTALVWTVFIGLVLTVIVLFRLLSSCRAELNYERNNALEWQEIANKAWKATGAAEEREKRANSIIDDFKRRIANL